jgi:hypothetical protein
VGQDHEKLGHVCEKHDLILGHVSEKLPLNLGHDPENRWVMIMKNQPFFWVMIIENHILETGNPRNVPLYQRFGFEPSVPISMRHLTVLKLVKKGEKEHCSGRPEGGIWEGDFGGGYGAELRRAKRG